MEARRANLGVSLLRAAMAGAAPPGRGGDAAAGGGLSADVEAPKNNEVAEADRGATGGALLRAVLGPLGRLLAKDEAQLDEDNDHGDAERWYCERGFEIADCIESGMAREVSMDFMQPLRRSSRLWRFRVLRSEDKLQHRLVSEDGQFLMHAAVSLQARRVQFFLYSPGAKDGGLFDAARPAFVMHFDEKGDEWRVVQERCDNCHFAPAHASCSAHGKQQVAFIRQSRLPVGDGVFNHMEVRIPGIYSDGSYVVWCPMLGRGDLGSAADGPETQRLVTRQATWNEQVGSLVLEFKGRDILPSSKNFQLALQQKPGHTICQFGKLGPTNFSLDFRFPLNVIQAFSVSLTTMFWT